MRINHLALITVLLTSAALPGLAAASVIYTYTGNPYDRFETEGVPPPNPYNLGMSVSATFVLDEAVGPNRPVETNFMSPISWSVSDGAFTLDNSNTTTVAFTLGTDENGVITSWYFFATSDPLVAFGEDYHQIASSFDAGPFRPDYDLGNTVDCIDFNTIGACNNNNRVTAFADTPGTWTVSPVPLPGTAWLFGGALLALGAWRRGRGA